VDTLCNSKPFESSAFENITRGLNRSEQIEQIGSQTTKSTNTVFQPLWLLAHIDSTSDVVIAALANGNNNCRYQRTTHISNAYSAIFSLLFTRVIAEFLSAINHTNKFIHKSALPRQAKIAIIGYLSKLVRSTSR
jgi:hypothetical protein